MVSIGWVIYFIIYLVPIMQAITATLGLDIDVCNVVIYILIRFEFQ